MARFSCLSTARAGGFVLITVLMLLLLFTIAGLGTLYSVQSSIKGTGHLRQDTVQFYGADGGAVAVLGYMTAFKTTIVPQDVKETGNYVVNIRVLGETVRYPPGFSTLWKGSDVVENSISLPDRKAEVEVVAFIPTSPAGYGNE